MDLPIKNNLAQQLALWTAGTKESVGGFSAHSQARVSGEGAGVAEKRSRTESFSIVFMEQSVEAVKMQHAHMQPPIKPKPFNVLKNFTNKPIEKRKGIAVVHNLEPPPFVPPALPDRAHSGGTRMRTAGEGKTENMLQAVDDDDDFMANLDIDSMVADARASSQGSQGRSALAPASSSQTVPGNAEKARQREALAEKQRQYAREHEERMKLVEKEMKALEDIDMDEVFDDPSPQGFGSRSDSAGGLASGGRGGMFHQDIDRTVHGNMLSGEGRGVGALDFGPRDGSRPSALRSSGLGEGGNGGFRGGGDIFGGNSAGGMRGGSDFGGGWSGDNGGRGQFGGGGFGGGGQFGRMGNDWGSGRGDGVRDFHANVDEGCLQYPEQPPLQLPDAVGEIEPETDKEIARLTNDTCTWGSPADLSLATKKFSHAKDVRVINREVFKNKGFRTHQEEVINAALSGKDVFVLMPTGGGKSLCYQICAMIQPGITVVISPLVSLMQDQVYNLRLLRVPAICLNGNSTQEEVNKAYRCFQMTSKEETPAAQLIYITPEKYSKSGRIRSEMKRCRQNGFLNRVVIDEAHCVSEWGHDFRPDYKMLGTLKQELSNVPIMALTATATKRVRQDIRKILGIRHSYIFIQSFNRPNLIYEVRQKKKNYQEELVKFIKENYRGETGIVYCLSKHRCEDMAECLNKEGIRAKPYHAGLDDDVRRANQDDWSNDKTHVICATIAFGMGINKPDVRFVVHDSLPKSMEGYYQESGRAGRDGKRSHCILYYTYRDKLTHDKMSEEDYKDKRQRMRGEDLREAEKQRDNLRDQLNSMVAYCESTNDCRRILLMSYFNEDFKGHCGKTCDNCASGKTGSAERRDVTNEAEAYVNIVEHFERLRVTKSIGFFIKLFRGSQAKDAIEYKDVQGYGVGKSMKEADAERLYRLLVQNNILLEKSEHNSVSLFGGTLTSLGVGPKRHLLRSEGLQMAFEALPEKPAGKSRKGKAAKGRGEEVQLPSTVKERKPSTKRRQPIEKIDDSEEEEDILVDMTKGRNAPVVLDKLDMTDGLGFKGNKAMTKEQQEDLYEGLRKCREENFKKLRTSTLKREDQIFTKDELKLMVHAGPVKTSQLKKVLATSSAMSLGAIRERIRNYGSMFTDYISGFLSNKEIEPFCDVEEDEEEEEDAPLGLEHLAGMAYGESPVESPYFSKPDARTWPTAVDSRAGAAAAGGGGGAQHVSNSLAGPSSVHRGPSSVHGQAAAVRNGHEEDAFQWQQSASQTQRKKRARLSLDKGETARQEFSQTLSQWGADGAAGCGDESGGGNDGDGAPSQLFDRALSEQFIVRLKSRRLVEKGATQFEEQANLQVITSCVDGENSQRIEWQLSDGQLSFNALVDREKAAGVPVHSVVRLLNWKIIRLPDGSRLKKPSPCLWKIEDFLCLRTGSKIEGDPQPMDWSWP